MYSEEELDDLLFDDYENVNYEVVLSKLNSILQEEPDNKYALKLKIEVLSCSGKDNDALELCNQCLKYSQDIEFLIAKADILLYLKKYKECIELCNQILLVNPENEDVRNTLDIALYEVEKQNHSQSDFVVLFIKIIVVLLSFFWIVYFHPTRETMVCNEQFNCRIEHEFFNKFVFTRYLKLNLYSNIELKKTSNFYHEKDTVRIKYDGKDPFIVYVLRSPFGIDNSEFNEFYQNEYNKFLAYKKNPKNGYIIQSYADLYLLFESLFVFFLLFIAPYCVFIRFKDILERYKFFRSNNTGVEDVQ